MDRRRTINEISAVDKSLGSLAREAEASASEDNYFAANACLFVLAEQGVKLALDKTEGHFASCIEEAGETGLLASEEKVFLNDLRQLRNKMFHENHHTLALESKGGSIYPLSEAGSKRKIYDDVSEECLELVLKLIS